MKSFPVPNIKYWRLKFLQNSAMHKHGHSVHLPILHVPLVPEIPQKLNCPSGPFSGRQSGGAASKVGARDQDGPHLPQWKQGTASRHKVTCIFAFVNKPSPRLKMDRNGKT